MASAASSCLSIKTVSYKRPLRTKGSGVRISSGAPEEINLGTGKRLFYYLDLLLSVKGLGEAQETENDWNK